MPFLLSRVVRVFFALAALATVAGCGARTRLRAPTVDAALPDAPLDIVAIDTPITFDVVDPCSRLGVDEMGCGFPDGTRIPFNEETVHGCIRCLCTESGGLFCTDLCGSPEDDAGPHMARRCLMPDGQRVFTASWALVGTVWCYCDSGGGGHCRLPQCTDGGGVVSPPPVIGPTAACNSLPLETASPPMRTRFNGPPPAPSGGTLEDGIYRLSDVHSYEGAPLGADTAAMLSVEGTHVQIARYTADRASIERATYEIEETPMGTVWWETCPQSTRPVFAMRPGDGGLVLLPDGGPLVLDPGRPFYPLYNVEGATIRLFDPESRSVEFVYRLTP